MPNGMTAQLIDLYHRSDGDISQAIFDGLERVERLADLLALAGFGAALVLEVVGTSPPFCREGVSFKVATLQGRIVNSPVAVAPEVLEGARVAGSDHLPLRHLREGLSANLPTMALASFWNALERMADEEARELGLKRIVRCYKCGDERHVGWDIKKGFESMYANAQVDADFDRQRALRGRVQHGDAIFSTSSPSEFLPEVTRLQSAAITRVAKRIGLLPQAGVYLRTNTPVAVFDCVISGETCTYDVQAFRVGAVPSLLPMRASGNRDRMFQAGVDLPTQIDPLVLPPVERIAKG